jgi:hypothetical protein
MSAAPVPPPEAAGPEAAAAAGEETAARSLLERTLTALVRQVVNGIPGVPSQGPVVAAAQRLLDKCDGNVEAAVRRVSESADTGWGDSCIRFLAGLVPLGGMAVRLEGLWFQLRAVAFVAALYGHDLSDSVVCYRMLICLVDAKVSDRPAATGGSEPGDPLVRGARTVVSDVANRVSNGGVVSVLVDSLTGTTIDALVMRAREHFRPQNAFSYFKLLALFMVCVTARILTPLLALSYTTHSLAAGTLGEGGRFSFVLPSAVRHLPLVGFVATMIVMALMVSGAVAVLCLAALCLLRLVRTYPSSFSFVIMCVPPIAQAALARSAALALALTVSDGSLVHAAGGTTVIGISWHAHKALYGFCAVANQRFDSASLRTMLKGLQWTLVYWPLEGLAKWALAGGGLAQLGPLGTVCVDVTSIVSLSLLSLELQKTHVLVKLLEWGMVGESTALCQSLMTIAAGVGGSIGSALIADPSQLVAWIDRATPAPNLCALVVATSMFAPHMLAAHAFVTHAGVFPGFVAGAGVFQWVVVVALALSCTMNYVWQSESEQLTSRCRVFVLLPGTDRMRVLRSAVQWVGAYELAQKELKKVRLRCTRPPVLGNLGYCVGS